jgi:type III pantothenate kinase
MTPDLVVDVGNSRVKWGLCRGGAVVRSASLAHDPPEVWERQLAEWGLAGQLHWVISGVHPKTRDRLVEWARLRGDVVIRLEKAAQLPLTVQVERPDWVGIDRLLDAVAANRRRRSGVPAAIVDSGSAVTVDYLDENGAYRGGAIFPGLRLMAKSLNDYTALLPLIEVRPPGVALPASSTLAAMEGGIYRAVTGGIREVLEGYSGLAGAGGSIDVFFTGGDAALLSPALGKDVCLWPDMTLEGARLTAETWP